MIHRYYSRPFVYAWLDPFVAHINYLCNMQNSLQQISFSGLLQFSRRDCFYSEHLLCLSWQLSCGYALLLLCSLDAAYELYLVLLCRFSHYVLQIHSHFFGIFIQHLEVNSLWIVSTTNLSLYLLITLVYGQKVKLISKSGRRKIVVHFFTTSLFFSKFQQGYLLEWFPFIYLQTIFLVWNKFQLVKFFFCCRIIFITYYP